MPITTTSKDTLSDGTTSVSFSQMRDYYGITGPVSLSGSLNKSTITVPDTLPEVEEEISVSDFRTKNRILVKMGITDTITEGDSSSWAPRQPDAVQLHVYTIGGGGSGGASTADGGREKGGSGGGAGGVAFRRYTPEELVQAVITVGDGGAAVSTASNSGNSKTGRDGGTTTFISYDSDGDITYMMSGGGGQRGRGGRQGIGSLSGSTSMSDIGRWGFAHGAVAMGGLGGEQNYISGGSPTVYPYAGSAFTIDGVTYPADTTNRDGAAVSSGGSVNLGFGVAGGVNPNAGTSNEYLDFQGLEAEVDLFSIAPQPVIPFEWENHVIAEDHRGVNVLCTFQGGTSKANESLVGNGTPIGAGGGGSARLNSSTSSGTGSKGGVIVTYYGLPNATVVDYDLPELPTTAPARVQLPFPAYQVSAFSGTLSGTCTAEIEITSGGLVTFAVSSSAQGGGSEPDDFTWLLSGNAIDYEVRFLHVESIRGGEMEEDAGTGWLNLSTTRTWRVFDDGNSGEPSFTSGTFSIRDATSTLVLASTEVTLRAIQSP